MTRLFVGIDVGLTGATALPDSAGALLAVYDMGSLRDGATNRTTVNAPLLAAILVSGHAGP
jgi:hypothetical protein